jgi:uncharacterized protein (TIGR02246 family)
MPAKQPQDLHTLFTNAFNAGSAEGLLALYEENASFVTGPAASVTGKAAIAEVVAGFLSLNGTVQLDTVSVTEGGGDIALIEGRWTLDGTDPEGNAVHLTGSSREVVRRQPDGSWLYVIDNPGTES